jgi:hypothetical protein
MRLDDLRRLRREGSQQDMSPPDDERDLEAGLTEMDRRFDPDEGAAENDDPSMILEPRLCDAGGGQIPNRENPAAGRTGQDARQIRFSTVGKDQAVVAERLSVIQDQAA